MPFDIAFLLKVRKLILFSGKEKFPKLLPPLPSMNKHQPAKFFYQWILLGMALCVVSCVDFSHEFAHNQEVPGRVWKIITVDWKWKAENDFKGMSEVITGHEYQGMRTIARTDSSKRDGLYFIVDLNRALSALPKGACMTIEYITSESALISTQRFAINSRSLSSELYLGLTGSAKPSSDKAEIVAWHILLHDVSGNLLAQKESFAWRF